ncbi:hypothetical protein F4859DRAFT_514094 [Xylaria cf. heliscus]|nr:hypothetical protein F4859DRAFT_514094 [Xylaria cf. heliscus]
MRALGRPSRQLSRLCQIHSLHQQVAAVPAVQRCRHSSSASNVSIPGTSIKSFGDIRAEMLRRKPQVHLDMMSPQHSALLTRALLEFLPGECYTKQQLDLEKVYPRGQDGQYFDKHPRLAPGHHLIYFPLKQRGSELCPDGTDRYHSPLNTPFTRRMWAGGSVHGFRGMVLDGKLGVCSEHIADVHVQDFAGAEKIFVEVARTYASPEPGHALNGISERRILVFMREPSDEERRVNLEKERRIITPPTNPDYTVTLTPTPTLLFHYSALSYNAHRIHLDRSYCREVEGYPDLLVHGPLSLTLVLSVLESQLNTEEGEFIDSIEYRHVAPLYVGQPMRICVKRRKPPVSEITEERKVVAEMKLIRNKWDLWIENQDGSLCFRGRAETMNF